MNKFVGRGEALAKVILQHIFPGIAWRDQYPLESLISPELHESLREDLKKHNFDFVGFLQNTDACICLEVNYKHGETAAKKLTKYKKMMNDLGIYFLEINHWDCRSNLPRQRGLFTKNSKGKHPNTWNDWRDVIDALEAQGFQPFQFGI